MKNEIRYTSSNGIDEIDAIIWDCENPKYILQIAHGMCEYIDRYEPLAKFLNERNIIVAGNNHLGHGKTAKILGYFGNGDTLSNVISDINLLSNMLKEKYNLPIYYLGHSMGSFIMRYYISKYNVQKCILMGTGHISKFNARLLYLLSSIIVKIKGEKYVSGLLLNLTTGSYSNKDEGMYDWISYNKENIKNYVEDEFCGYPFTANGYKTLGQCLVKINDKSNLESTPKDTALLFISGSDDAVGGFKKGVRKVYNNYKNLGFKNLELKFYKNMKHEILNEENNKNVYEKIYEFLEK